MSVDHDSLAWRLRLAQDAGCVGICVWQAADDSFACDERARAALGLEPGEVLTRAGLEARILPEDLPAKRAAWEAALADTGGGEFRAEFRIRRPGDREIIPVVAVGTVERLDGRPARMAIAVRDISRERRASEAVRRSEARLSGILAIAIDAIISIDAGHRITLFNTGAEAIFGWRSEEVVGKPLDLLLPERFRTGHRRHVEAFGASGVVARTMGSRREILGLRKSGEEFLAEASISVLDLDGERTFTAVLRDVTERRRAHEKLVESYAELERRVAERTRALSAEIERREQAQAQLVRTQRMEAFGQLTGGIAHDFNNLLTVVTGNLEILEMRLDDPTNLTLLRRAAEAAEMGARLTSRLLTFARRRTYEIAVIDLNQQVTGLVDLLRRTLGETVELSTRLAPRLWKVRADRSEIENAILNLAINARDAMPKGGRLVIETVNMTLAEGAEGIGHRLPAGDYVRLTVTDTGTGMPPEVARRAFEPFFTTKEPGRGTGLGLSTLYGFVNELGGTVMLDSRPGEGTRVTLYLPRSDAPPAPTRAGARPLVPASAGETVLLVEDHAEVREVTRARLEELGYQVLEAANGPAALAILRSDRAIDIVFSDIVMPGGMSGYDVARAAAELRAGIRVLLTSGYADEAQQQLMGEAGALRVLAKPYDQGELARAIREALDG
jgi:PAS domain S-box-containing protein